jgi:hypothetical protein
MPLRRDEAIEVPGDQVAGMKQNPWFAPETGTTNQPMVIGNNSAHGHSTVLALALKREKTDNGAFLANNRHLNVATHRSHRLDEFGGKKRVA